MRVQSVGQQNNTKTSSVLKAGVAGALGGALVRNFMPLTTNEHNFYFNESAKNAIREKVQKVRLNEVEKIASEYKSGTINLSKDAFDVFEKSKDSIVKEPKKAMNLLDDSAEAVKKAVKPLFERVNSVGAAKKHIEVASIKSAAKASRPLAFYVAMGALLLMSVQIIANAIKAALPKEETPVDAKKNLTMADVLLEGLGENKAEILFLNN